MQLDHDVIVIGGGAAGLSAAVALARSRRSVLVIDAGEPRNGPAEGVHNFLSRESTAPLELLAAGRGEAERYGAQLRTGQATRAQALGAGFAVTLEGGGRVTGRRLVVTTGLVDELPEIDGLAARWGKDVLHCPYCHGWEVRDQAIAVLATTAMSAHQALMFGQLSDDVTFLAGETEVDEDSTAMLAAAGIPILGGRVDRVLVEDGQLTGVRLADGQMVAAQAVVVGSRMEARTEVLASLDVETCEHPTGMGTQVVVDDMGQTTQPGVYAAGNVVDLAAMVMGAAAAGTRVGAAVNVDLIMSDLREKVSA